MPQLVRESAEKVKARENALLKLLEAGVYSSMVDVA